MIEQATEQAAPPDVKHPRPWAIDPKCDSYIVDAEGRVVVWVGDRDDVKKIILDAVNAAERKEESE